MTGSDAALTDTPAQAGSDAAWVHIPTPLAPTILAGLCQDIEALLRINPYLVFSHWQRTGPCSYHAAYRNQSNGLPIEVDLDYQRETPDRYALRYRQGLKQRTVLTIEPTPYGSTLVITDEYDNRIAEPERRQREHEVDKSLPAWGAGLQTFFLRYRRWGWLPGWKWYMRRIWVPMKPSGRRIVWLLFLITVAEFFFFLFVLAIYVIEQTHSPSAM